jgi:elongation factor 1-gamma
MTKGKLYGDSANFRTQKVLAAAKYGKSDITIVKENPPHDKFPLGLTPAFEDGKTLLFGAESIALHVGGQAVKGQNQEHFPEVVQWLQWSEGQLLPNVLGYVLPSVSAVQVDKKAVDDSKSELLAQLHILNEYLLSRTFLVGERISLADISVALDLLPAYQHVLEPSTRANLTNVNRWFQTVVNQPEVKAVVGDVRLCDQASQFDSDKFKELAAKTAKEHPKEHGKGGHHHGHHGGHHHAQEEHHAKEEHPKEGKKKGGNKEKKEKPAAKEKEPEPEEDHDAADEALAQEPKAQDPFAAMPKGTFVMDNFKRVYSNEDTLTKAIPYFWENFDPENYSIWYAEYKFPEDLAATFMSCNLINGMFQRLEKLNKNAFASVCLFGTDNNSTISGVWIWRGHELAFPLSPDWTIDYESYKWTKLDPKDEKTKKIVNEYWAWEGDFDGKKFNQGKIFK